VSLSESCEFATKLIQNPVLVLDLRWLLDLAIYAQALSFIPTLVIY